MSPRLVLFAGPACAGKTTIARELAREAGLIAVDMDSFRARLMPDSEHTRPDRAVAYRGMHYAAELLLSAGHSVITDGGYGRREDRDDARQAAARSRAPMFVVEVEVPLHIALARCRERFQRHPGRDLTDERVREIVETYPFTREGLVISGTAPLDESVRRIQDYLGA